jgi:hypothetical protein
MWVAWQPRSIARRAGQGAPGLGARCPPPRPRRLLKKGSVAVVIGGIAEMYMQHPRKERVKLRGRRGFARIALEEQV